MVGIGQKIQQDKQAIMESDKMGFFLKLIAYPIAPLISLYCFYKGYNLFGSILAILVLIDVFNYLKNRNKNQKKEKEKDIKLGKVKSQWS